jgi:phage shock protein A
MSSQAQRELERARRHLAQCVRERDRFESQMDMTEEDQRRWRKLDADVRRAESDVDYALQETKRGTA